MFSSLKKQNTHSFQVHIEHSLGLTTKQDSTKLSVEIISSIFSDHSSMKLEISHRKSNKKKTITWKLKNMLLKKQ